VTTQTLQQRASKRRKLAPHAPASASLAHEYFAIDELARELKDKSKGYKTKPSPATARNHYLKESAPNSAFRSPANHSNYSKTPQFHCPASVEQTRKRCRAWGKRVDAPASSREHLRRRYRNPALLSASAHRHLLLSFKAPNGRIDRWRWGLAKHSMPRTLLRKRQA
jgi:hypothetical protein